MLSDVVQCRGSIFEYV